MMFRRSVTHSGKDSTACCRVRIGGSQVEQGEDAEEEIAVGQDLASGAEGDSSQEVEVDGAAVEQPQEGYGCGRAGRCHCAQC